ncbi:hypothetical protein ACFY2H_05810 [Streptomyces griseofuscus]|uniref:hypothetical protein n=1 Tax=Streptomyces griseofuscus TaxID=146922 RepID=UPI0036CA0584
MPRCRCGNRHASPSHAGPAWYALPLRYRQDQLAGLPVERFLVAVHAEGASEVDLPGSTRALGDHPLFHTPAALLPGYAGYQGPAADSFTTARRVHGSTVKLPVWHRDQDLHLADAYTAATVDRMCLSD